MIFGFASSMFVEYQTHVGLPHTVLFGTFISFSITIKTDIPNTEGVSEPLVHYKSVKCSSSTSRTIFFLYPCSRPTIQSPILQSRFHLGSPDTPGKGNSLLRLQRLDSRGRDSEGREILSVFAPLYAIIAQCRVFIKVVCDNISTSLVLSIARTR